MRLRVLAAAAVAAAVALAAPSAQANWTALGGPLNVDTANDAETPRIADVGGVPWAVWVEGSGARVKRLNGSSFEAVGGPLNDDPAQGIFATSIAGVGGEAWVATSEAVGFDPKIRVKRWTGSAWQTVGAIFPDVQSIYPDLATVGGTPYVAYLGYDGTLAAVVRRWNGSAWEQVGGHISSGAVEQSIDTVSIADVGGVPTVAYVQTESGKRVLRVAQWNGTSWAGVGDVVSRPSADYVLSPSLVDYGGAPVVAWTEVGSDNSVRTLVSRWTGSGWSAIGSPFVGGDNGFFTGASNDLTVAGGSLYLARGQDAADTRVVVSHWNGTRWTDVGGPLNRGVADAADPKIATVAGKPVVAWWQYVNLGDGKIYADRLDPDSVAFSTATYSVAESGGQAAVTVRRTGGSTGTAVIDYAVTGGTASPDDFTGGSGTLTFADGQTEQTIVVPIADDGKVEPDETVNLALSNPGGDASVGTPSTAVLTIVNDDLIDTIISIGPEGNTADTSPAFIFSADPSGGATFECWLDDDPPAACSPPFQRDLTQGPHVFHVRAFTPGGQPDTTPATRSFFVDSVRPVTTLSVNGTKSGDTFTSAVTVTPSSSDAAPSSGIREARCVVNPPQPPQTASELPTGACPAVTIDTGGTYTVYAAAVDGAGNAGIPAVVSLNVAPSPDTTITSGPRGITPAAPTFEFTSTLPGSTFECRFDSGAFAPCRSGQTFYGLTAGVDHTFSVRAVGPGGLRDPVPATRLFKIGTVTGSDKCVTEVTTYLPAGWGCPSKVSGICPVGAKCSLSLTATVKFAGVDVKAWVHPPSGEDCATRPDNEIPFICPHTSKSSRLGDNTPFGPTCTGGNTSPPGGWPAGARITTTCTLTWTIEPAEPLGAVAFGANAETTVAGPGQLAVSTPQTASKRILVLGASTRKRRVPYMKPVKINAKREGVVKIPVKLSKTAKGILRKRHKLRLALTLKFTPAGSKKPVIRKQRVTLTR